MVNSIINPSIPLPIFPKGGYSNKQAIDNMLNSYAEFNNFDLTKSRGKKGQNLL